MSEAIVLLHGFGGTHRTWDRVVALLDRERYRPLALDLRGHGAASDRRPIGFGEVVGDVLATAPERFVLAGYSMGGRIAQHVALAAPERVTRLVLVSTTAGIEDARERAARAAADDTLAGEVERGTIREFASRWRAQPLFAGDPPEVEALAREDYLRNEPAALAAALRSLSTGRMAPVWERLGELRMPVGVVVGERDARYVALGELLRERVPRGRTEVVPGAGHAVHLEAPAAVARALSMS